MPTPDPIALPELPKSLDSVRVIARGVPESARPHGHYYNVEQLRAYGQACVDALTSEPQVPEGMVLVPREATLEMVAAGAKVLGASFGLQFAYTAMLSAAPPLNELLGQREEFNLNEVSGNPGQLASLEQRAREDELPPGFVWLTASAAHLSDAAANIRQLAEDVGAYDEPAGIVPAPNQARLLADIADALEADALFHRTAALSAQPREVRGVEVVELLDVTDAEIAEWLERHDLTQAIRGSDARAAFEDAQSFHMTKAAATPQDAAGEQSND